MSYDIPHVSLDHYHELIVLMYMYIHISVSFPLYLSPTPHRGPVYTYLTC